MLQDAEVTRFVSVVTLWEIATKTQIGKLVPPPYKFFHEEHIAQLNARTLAVQPKDVEALFELARLD